MNLGILNCDQLSEPLAKHYGTYPYPQMITRLFQNILPHMTFSIFNAQQGELPKDIHEVDAYIITGSKYGVNDGYPWIEQLEKFVRMLYVTRKKVIGICFGHQLIAKALGGKVIRSPAGWGVGVQKNTVLIHKPWMEPYQDHFNLLASHQDQVVALPPDTELLATSNFCINYMMQIRENLLGIQGHPEFTKEYARDLMEFREDIIEKDVIARAMNSLVLEHENDVIAHWMFHFLQT